MFKTVCPKPDIKTTKGLAIIMKRSIKALVSMLLVFVMLIPLSSCGDSKMTDASLLQIPERGVLGLTIDQLKKVDLNINDKSLHPMEKDLEDGRHRLKYVIPRDAFVDGGNWMTNVLYYFTDGKVTSYEIEYRQSDYSEGVCKKRMAMFTEYLNEKFGEARDEYVVLGEYAVKGSAWTIDGATFDMSRQNGGWILFTFHDPYTATPAE